MAELTVTGKTKFAILECKKFLEHFFLSRLSIAASLVCDFFFKVTSTKGNNRTDFTPSRDYRDLLAFWKLFFSSQRQSHLVKFGRKFNSDYKNNVLATLYDSFGHCNIAGK